MPRFTWLSLLIILSAWTLSGSDVALKILYDGHRWFELREAVRVQPASAFYKGAVASAFNDSHEAEKYLNSAARRARSVEEADEAHGMLAYLYTRLGRSRDALRHLDEMQKLKPGRADVLNARALFSALGQYPPQSIRRNRRSVVQCKVSEDGLTLPVSINGRTVEWGLDTGANLTITSEAEARMLGLEVHQVAARADDLAGGSSAVRTTIARRFVIGNVEFRNVPMLVLPDTQPPMNDSPAGERGVIGLPVAIAARAFRWCSDGRFEIGPAPHHVSRSEKNLCFDGLAALTRVEAEGKQLEFIFDTGNGGGTQLWQRFADDFAAALRERGRKESKRITQLGGSNMHQAMVLPEFGFRVGGFQATLRPANVFAKPVGNPHQHGLLGMDLLTQAREVSVDFDSMSLLLR